MFSSFIQNMLRVSTPDSSPNTYIAAFGLFVVLVFLFLIAQKILLVYLKKVTKKTKTEIDDLVLSIFSKIGIYFYIYLAFFITSLTLPVPPIANNVFVSILFIWITYIVIIALQLVIDFSLRKYNRRAKDIGTREALNNIAKIAKVLLWVFGIFVILSNLGINVSSLLAGLGIGGVAIALALQNILGDLFSSFAIYFDKPFVVGDFIVVGDKMGVVEKIGIKTTRLRALQGEEIVMSNKELTSAQVQNFKKMKNRRVVFSFGVTYETPQKQLKKIPDIIKKVIQYTKRARFERAHFFRFDDSALYFEVVYYVTSGDYTLYMDTQQSINFAIRDAFEKERISMAYPTQTLYVSKP